MEIDLAEHWEDRDIASSHQYPSESGSASSGDPHQCPGTVCHRIDLGAARCVLRSAALSCRIEAKSKLPGRLPSGVSYYVRASRVFLISARQWTSSAGGAIRIADWRHAVGKRTRRDCGLSRSRGLRVLTCPTPTHPATRSEKGSAGWFRDVLLNHKLELFVSKGRQRMRSTYSLGPAVFVLAFVILNGPSVAGPRNNEVLTSQSSIESKCRAAVRAELRGPQCGQVVYVWHEDDDPACYISPYLQPSYTDKVIQCVARGGWKRATR